ncbi:PREDICTED: tRNA-dihydrouridine(16/17) synthase [NAD(P)(+)]-like [Amphimedon queenslandica]|uniref:tRNA-dihydrouridine(16/17) synthase [NAD(P)(+)] n=1 Tax=Amphimedon queenslandica TaxID=400682 RepID=A0A1X7V7N5_AMPQE|nr:PREDICTED: tRNA-dihydrouridine(16/17) synthase [NAD(P)(+)]-like [Amphimedon queenslandica]|eukprot:XP_003385465.3 PREDICTED: tRNA-dihydrouridine(16/17) synthase [NAD(P)(+)]-like [Amphimedon queenslandica]
MAARSGVKKNGFQFWKEDLGSPKLIVAPMVDQSELAWRLFSRQHGAELCYTPMMHASLFRQSPKYRRENFATCAEDRPLIAQFCANDPQVLLEAARYVEEDCDAVDINLGCPQTIAKRGHYGAFLQDEWDLIAKMVNLLHCELSVPVTCKIRVFEDIDKTVRYAKMLESAGCQLLTVHGRTRSQKGMLTGIASWEHIKAVKENLSIPVFANGNIRFLDDVKKCLDETRVEGVMSAEGNLFNPGLFHGEQLACWSAVDEYLSWVKLYPPSISIVRGHLFKLWHHVLQTPGYDHFRDKIATAKTIEGFELVSSELKSLLLSNITEEELKSEYSCTIGSIPYWRCQPYVRPSCDMKRSRAADGPSDNGGQATPANRKKKRKKVSDSSPLTGNKEGSVKKQWMLCVLCRTHPMGLKCVNKLCKRCCKIKSAHDLIDCTGHRLLFKTKFEKMKEQQQDQSVQIEELATVT